MEQDAHRQAGGRSGIAAALVLVLLTLHVGHIYWHACETTGASENLAAAQKEGVSDSADKKPASSGLQPCLACRCQMQKLVLSSSATLLLHPLPVRYSAAELEQFHESCPALQLNLSRAPPPAA